MASFGQLYMNRSNMCCFQAEPARATMSSPSVMRPVEAASSGVSQNEETRAEAEPTDDGCEYE